jgi:hypothetical protein
MRDIRFEFSHMQDGNGAERIGESFPYLERLSLEGTWKLSKTVNPMSIRPFAKFPFLKALKLSVRTYVLDNSEEMELLLSRLSYLEELSFAISLPLLAPFFASRHSFSDKLRLLDIHIFEQTKTFFPELLDINLKLIPEWCSTRAPNPPKQPEWSDVSSTDSEPQLNKLTPVPPLFPSLLDFGITKICCFPNRFWSLLARDICPNIHVLRLKGDMRPGRSMLGPDFQTVDNVLEESKTEEIVRKLLDMFRGITTLYLDGCWKTGFVETYEGQKCPAGYLEKKHQFLQSLRDRKIAALIRYDITGCYGHDPSFASMQRDSSSQNGKSLVYR